VIQIPHSQILLQMNNEKIDIIWVLQEIKYMMFSLWNQVTTRNVNINPTPEFHKISQFHVKWVTSAILSNNTFYYPELGKPKIRIKQKTFLSYVPGNDHIPNLQSPSKIPLYWNSYY
jgi:hypothetical protein